LLLVDSMICVTCLGLFGSSLDVQVVLIMTDLHSEDMVRSGQVRSGFPEREYKFAIGPKVIYTYISSLYYAEDRQAKHQRT